MCMGQRIKLLRKKAGLTQTELGDKLGIKKAAVAKYESGQVQNIKRKTIAKMAELFDVSPSYLLCLDDQKVSPHPDPETIEIVNVINQRPEIKRLLNLSRGASDDDIEMVTTLLEQLINRGGLQ